MRTYKTNNPAWDGQYAIENSVGLIRVDTERFATLFRAKLDASMMSRNGFHGDCWPVKLVCPARPLVVGGVACPMCAEKIFDYYEFVWHCAQNHASLISRHATKYGVEVFRCSCGVILSQEKMADHLRNEDLGTHLAEGVLNRSIQHEYNRKSV